MLLKKFDSVQNKKCKRLLEHILYLAILFVCIPTFIYFELCVVLPYISGESTVAYTVHIINATFLLHNIIGNMMCGMFIDSSIKGRLLSPKNENWIFCDICECLIPPRAWHCSTCDICVLKRDHHCSFLASCVGYYNQRYFMLFTFHIFIAMLYAMIYNCIYLSSFITWKHGLLLAQIFFPIASVAFDSSYESIIIFLFVINVIVCLFTGFLFLYHMNNVLRGTIVPENKSIDKKYLYDKGWKANIIEVFGTKWYLTWISPFIISQLSGNGIDFPGEKCD